MNPTTLPPGRARSSISRRTVVVGTAWAVPAVVVASAAPALAASGVTVGIGAICIGTGNTLRIQLTVSNPTGAAGTTTINSLTIAGVLLNTGALGPRPFPASASSTVVITVPNVGLSETGVSVAVALGYAVTVGGTTTTGTVNASVIIFGVGNCPF
jgi:hypothetical protein